jgi:predicted DCC family thiol-disulfide oxidoreductase YuxK
MPVVTDLQARNGDLPCSRGAGRALVLYDGQCPLCRKSVKVLRRLDWLAALGYVDVRSPEELRRCTPPVAPERLLEEMHLLTPGREEVYHGFKAFRWMAWRLPVLWFLVPLLYLPGAESLGQRAYLWVARNRLNLVPCHGGVCTLPVRPTPGQVGTVSGPQGGSGGG